MVLIFLVTDIDGWTPIMYACKYSPTIVPDLLKAGAKVNGSDNDGWTPLMFARKFSFSIIPDLLKYGAE